MDNRIYLTDLPCYLTATATQKKKVGKNPYYDLESLPSQTMREEMADFLRSRGRKVSISTIYGEHCFYIKICSFLQKRAKRIKSFRGRQKETWLRQLKGWLLEENIPLTYDSHGVYGNVSVVQSRITSYLKWILEFVEEEADNRAEQEKDIWKLEKLDIPIKENPIRDFKTINFKEIPQNGIREELKKVIYWHLQEKTIFSVQKEMTTMRRLTKYLAEKEKKVQSCHDITRTVLEEYLIYLKTENPSMKNYHTDLSQLRSILEGIGNICDYENLNGLFLKWDIPPSQRAEFKTYSDEELKRLNANIIKMDEQYARVMIIHQMLGTRISDTLTLEMDCLYETGAETIIKIRQMKTKTYQKPISEELAALIRKAMAYTKERYGQTKYLFVNDDNPNRPLQYSTIQSKVVAMIQREKLRDDNGRLFGFGTHMYRHYYGVKLTEMHLDDFTIAKLLGHGSVQNVKYYRKMSNQVLADETREVRQLLSEIILQNLDGWEPEYEQIRQNACFKQKSER